MPESGNGKKGTVPEELRQTLLIKTCEGMASSFRWALASMLAVDGGALVALMQSTSAPQLYFSGWWFIGGLVSTLLSGIVSIIVMVCAFGAIPVAEGREDSRWEDKFGAAMILLAMLAAVLLLISLALSVAGFVAIQLSLMR